MPFWAESRAAAQQKYLLMRQPHFYYGRDYRKLYQAAKILPELLNQMTNSTTDDAILDADGANHGADHMEGRLLSGLKQNPYITQTDLAKELSLSRRTVQRIMKELMNDGKIKRVGSTRTGHWEIND